MFQSPPREKPWMSWLAFAAWSAVIFSAIPFARTAQRWVAGHWGADALRWLAIVVIAIAATAAAIYVWRRLRGHSWRNIAWLGATVAVFVYLSLAKMKTPGEAVHFIEYGFLGLLAFRALAHRQRDRLVYACALVLCTLVGTVDEILQWMTPGRYWDVRDIGHNAVAGLLAQLALSRGLRPPFIRGPVAPRSVRRLGLLLALQMLMLGLCASNTPVAVAWYTDRVPRLEFLRENDSPMSEYGYRHEDPDIGRFYSRFAEDDLHWLDGRRAADAGPVIAYYLGEGTYSNFLQRYTPAVDPFLHEAMVHVFRRNHYEAVIWKHRDNPRMHRLHCTVAYRENQILERYFPATLAAAGQTWEPGRAARLMPFLRADRVYKSEVSKHLITHVTERDIWTIIACLLGLDLIMVLLWGIERPRGRGVPADATDAAAHI